MTLRRDMLTPEKFLYLPRAQVDALMPSTKELESIVEKVFAHLATGASLNARHSRMEADPGSFYQAMPARLNEAGHVGTKWLCAATNADNGRPDLPHINSLILLNDLPTAVVQAAMDGDLITARRPAIVSLVGARRLARSDSKRIGFIACGAQARGHFDVLSQNYPLSEVTCYSRNPETAEAFAAELRERGYQARMVTNPREAVEAQDIVVTSVPMSRESKPFLDPRWAAPGACVLVTDLARSWFTEHLRTADLLVTDNHTATQGRTQWDGTFDSDLSELVSGARPGRKSADERAFFVHPGLGVCDVAIAAEVFKRAVAAGKGVVLER